MKKALAGAALLSIVSTLGTSGIAAAQDKEEKESFTYATYYYCDVSQQDRLDALVEKLDKPLYEAAIADGSLTGWGFLVHNTGGKWRRVEYGTAPSIDALMAAGDKIIEQSEAGKNKALSTEESKICNAHDDYIWRRVAGTAGTRGKIGMSTYYVCDQTREDQADALMKRVFGPMLDKMVSDGKLTTWGWQEHIVGGEYRRLATLTAADMKALNAARASIVAALQADPLGTTFTDICGSHTDYIWEIKFEKP
jgi:hypothetical protein